MSEDCSICHHPIALPSGVTLALCGQGFCRPCLSSWISEREKSGGNVSCPNCRTAVSWQDVIEVLGRPDFGSIEYKNIQLHVRGLSAIKSEVFKVPLYTTSDTLVRSLGLRTKGTRVLMYNTAEYVGCLATVTGTEHGGTKIKVEVDAYEYELVEGNEMKVKRTVKARVEDPGNLKFVSASWYNVAVFRNTPQKHVMAPGFGQPSSDPSKNVYEYESMEIIPQRTTTGYRTRISGTERRTGTLAFHEYMVVSHYCPGPGESIFIGEADMKNNRLFRLIGERIRDLLILHSREADEIWKTAMWEVEVSSQENYYLCARNSFLDSHKKLSINFRHSITRAMLVHMGAPFDGALYRLLGEDPRSVDDVAKYERDIRLQGLTPFAKILEICGQYIIASDFVATVYLTSFLEPIGDMNERIRNLIPTLRSGWNERPSSAAHVEDADGSSFLALGDERSRRIDLELQKWK